MFLSFYDFLFDLFYCVFYFFFVYMPNRRMGVGGGFQFEIPGLADRKRIQELQGQIHHLDKAHHHMELGDIYLKQGKTAEAEKCFRAAYERDAEDIFEVGTIGTIIQLLRLPDGTVKVLVEGKRRARISRLYFTNKGVTARIFFLPTSSPHCGRGCG